MTVVDAEGPADRKESARSGSPQTARQLDLQSAILRLVEQDPFASIGEIKTEINLNPGDLQASWWQVFSILRSNKLLTRRSRFKYILGRR